MTGRYAFRTGGLTNQSWRGGGPGAKSADEYPMARLMKQAGYATGQAGKWRQLGELPGDWGFDEFLTDNTAGGWYWETKYNKNGKVLNLPEGTYGPDVIQDFTFDFIRRHKDKPFFFYYAMHLVHKPTLRTPDTVPGTKNIDKLYDDNIRYMDKQLGAAGRRVGQAGAAAEHVDRLLRRQRHRRRLPQPGPWPHDQRLEREHAGGRIARPVHRKLARRDARGKGARRHRELCRSVRHLRRDLPASSRPKASRPTARASPRNSAASRARPAHGPTSSLGSHWYRPRAGIQDERGGRTVRYERCALRREACCSRCRYGAEQSRAAATLRGLGGTQSGRRQDGPGRRRPPQQQAAPTSSGLGPRCRPVEIGRYFAKRAGAEHCPESRWRYRRRSSRPEPKA